jgi:SNF2 family DNA or RNA helicase
LKYYGTIKLNKELEAWEIRCEPQVRLKLKAIFGKIRKYETEVIHLNNTPENCMDLHWFLQRYPLKVKEFTLLKEGVSKYKETQRRLNMMQEEGFQFQNFKMKYPLRDYQKIVPQTIFEQGFVLCGDDLGVGKTVMAIATFTEQMTLPALVVCQPHLTDQWKDEVKKFLPDHRVHIIRKGSIHQLPRAEVLIISYTLLHKWVDVLVKLVKSVVFDEVQELRNMGPRRDILSLKYGAAKEICKYTKFQSGYSATPVYNYGDEIFNILDCLKEGCLGSEEEFYREWCETAANGKKRIINPTAFGAYLRDHHLMIRRTRKEIGRELPPVTRLPHVVQCNKEALDAIKTSSIELAKMIVNSKAWEERGLAARKFDNMLRQATGVAKAPYVAEFVKLLLESEEKIVLWGWHREVYDIWLQLLDDYKPVMYTGTESPRKKKLAKNSFVYGESRVMIMSLRSGVGLNDLQKVCWTGVFGELDWSPGVHDQCVGRLERDEQLNPMTVYYLMENEGGSDSAVAEILGVKKTQAVGIMQNKQEFVKQSKDLNRVKTMAEMYLKKHKAA